MVRFHVSDEDGTLEYGHAHGDIFGRGVHIDVYTKALLKHIAHNFDEMFNQSKRLVWTPPNANGTGEQWFAFRNRTFKQLTGFEYARVTEINQELEGNNQRLQPPKDRGPKPRDLVKEYPSLPGWFEDKAREANKGSYLTVPILMEAFKKEYALAGPTIDGRAIENKVSKVAMTAALHACVFSYGPRKLKRNTARASAKVLAELDKVLIYYVENTHLIWSDISGKWIFAFIEPHGVTDESYKQSSDYRIDSWHNENTSTRDQLGKNQRLTLLHSIFSGCSVTMQCEYWGTLWKKKHGNVPSDFFGKCNGNTIEAYYEKVFKAFPPKVEGRPPNVLLADNARMHKRLRTELRGSAEDVLDWVTDSDEVPDDTTKALYALAEKSTTWPTRAELVRILHADGVCIYETEKLARDNGARILWLPPYYSELSPVELYWCEVKRYYDSKTNTDLPWEERMRLAVESIQPAFVEGCWDRCIRWARQKYSERIEKLPDVVPAGAVHCQRHPLCTKLKHRGNCKLAATPAEAAAARAAASAAALAAAPAAAPAAVFAAAPGAAAEDAASIDSSEADFQARLAEAFASSSSEAEDDQAEFRFLDEEVDDSALLEELEVGDGLDHLIGDHYH